MHAQEMDEVDVLGHHNDVSGASGEKISRSRPSLKPRSRGSDAVIGIDGDPVPELGHAGALR
jgi:hypothetical protein